MRTGVAELHCRLKQTNFHHDKFSNQFTDMALSPIFEIVLADADVAGKRLSALAAREGRDAQPERQMQAARSPPPAPPDISAAFQPDV